MSKYKFILNKELKQKLLENGINPRKWKKKNKKVLNKPYIEYLKEKYPGQFNEGYLEL